MHPNESNQTAYTELDKWKPMVAFLEAHPQFNEGQMRWLLRHRKYNGLDEAVRKIGRNLYIHEDLFAVWIMGKSD